MPRVILFDDDHISLKHWKFVWVVGGRKGLVSEEEAHPVKACKNLSFFFLLFLQIKIKHKKTPMKDKRSFDF